MLLRLASFLVAGFVRAGRIAGCWIAVAAPMAAAPAAHALDLPLATSGVSCTTSIGVISDALFCSTATDQAQVTLQPFAGTHADAIYPGSSAIAAAASNAVLTYNWAVTGGQPGDLVHVDIGVNLSVDVFGPQGQAFAAVTVTTAPSGTVEACVSADGICGAGSTRGFNGSLQMVARSGDINTLQLQAKAGGSFGPDVNGGSAFADPHIFLDPAFPGGDAYQLVLSPGISNEMAPVPEPATWLMLGFGLAGLAGLAGLGAARRARQACTTLRPWPLAR